MSSVTELTEFERNARRLLEESVMRVDGRTRSRLNQARHAALEAALSARSRPRWWRSFTLMPAAGAVAAALLVTMVLWHREPVREPQSLDAHATEVQDIDLLADDEALDLMEGWDGPFYEWAASQTDGNGGESDT
jgi:hypothetical protein